MPEGCTKLPTCRSPPPRARTGRFSAALAATVADLAADAPSRRQLLAAGGGLFLDWLLQLAYPELPAVAATAAAATAAAAPPSSAVADPTAGLPGLPEGAADGGASASGAGGGLCGPEGVAGFWEQQQRLWQQQQQQQQQSGEAGEAGESGVAAQLRRLRLGLGPSPAGAAAGGAGEEDAAAARVAARRSLAAERALESILQDGELWLGISGGGSRSAVGSWILDFRAWVGTGARAWARAGAGSARRLGRRVSSRLGSPTGGFARLGQRGAAERLTCPS